MESETERKTLRVVGSLHVDNVQALASMKMKEIPNRYVRPEIDAEPTIGDDVQPEIPTVDLSRLLDERSSEEESEKLHLACEECGFFHLINHGVSGELIEKMKLDLIEFFKQSLEVKMRHSQLPGDIEGYGQAFVVSDEQKLDWADMFFLHIRPVSLRNMRFWSTQPPSFRETLDQYTMQLRKITDIILRAMAKNLGVVDPDILIDKFKERVQSVRMNYYPPCPQPDKALGLSPHSDIGALTILLQVNEVQGLQIMKDGLWVPVSPLANDSFVINVGDAMEVLSNGKYKSINHRSMVDPAKERLSIATFEGPGLGACIGPLPGTERDGEVYYKTMDYMEIVKLYLSAKLDGKGHMESIKMKN